MHEVIDSYADGMPTDLSALDIFKDQWVSAIPGSTIGSIPLFEDMRVTWAISKANGILGKTVLELGPLEGGHTYMLLNAGAKSVLALEANTRCYLKCLIVKEALEMANARFLFGNFSPWLQANKQQFDYIHASGVLYHMIDPIQLLDLLCQSTNQIYLWTHYVDVEAMRAKDPRYSEVVRVETAQAHGREYKLYRRHYQGSPTIDPKFCGGVHRNPAWLERQTILDVLSHNGFTSEIAHEAPDHPGGPSCSIFAQRVNR